MDAEGWKAWRRAEESLGDAERCVLAARELPERRGWILRAMDALERDDAEALLGLAEEAAKRHWVDLERAALLLHPDVPDRDPTTVRKLAKSRGLGNRGYPHLDLLRVVAAALDPAQRGKPNVPQALAEESRRDVVLYAVLMTMKGAYKPRALMGEFATRSPRLARYFLAAIALEDRDPMGFHARYGGGEPWPLAPERWGAPRSEAPVGPVEAWLQGREGAQWTWDTGIFLDFELKHEPRKAPGVIALVLARIDRLVRKGRVQEAQAALQWVDARVGMEGGPRALALGSQIAHLGLRLDWLAGEGRPVALMGAIWRRARKASPAVQRAVAESLVQPVEAFTEAMRLPFQAEAVLVWCTTPKEASARARRWLALERRLDVGTAQRAGRALGLEGGELALALAELALARGESQTAVEQLLLVAREPGRADLASELLAVVLEGRTGVLQRRERRRLEELVGVLAAGGSVDLALASIAPRKLPGLLGPEAAAAALDGLQEAAIVRLEGHLVRPGRAAASALLALLDWGQEERADRALRELGRDLVRARDRMAALSAACEMLDAFAGREPEAVRRWEASLVGLLRAADRGLVARAAAAVGLGEVPDRWLEDAKETRRG